MTKTGRQMVIAIDGPAAAGKGTLARNIAAQLGYAYLDTGLLYRAVALAMLRAGAEATDAAVALAAAEGLDFSAPDDAELRSEQVGRAASEVASHSDVRAKLREFQRNFASHPPDDKSGAVLDGRDIGTVICPDADIKIFVSASKEERARRRHAELWERGDTRQLDEIMADIEARDARDMSRADSPLRPADDAHLLDTTDLDIEGALRAALEIIDAGS